MFLVASMVRLAVCYSTLIECSQMVVRLFDAGKVCLFGQRAVGLRR